MNTKNSVNRNTVVISAVEGISTAIQKIAEYCQQNNAKTYEDVEKYCLEALKSYLQIQTSPSSYQFAIFNKMFENKYSDVVNQVANRLRIYPTIINKHQLSRFITAKQRVSNPITFLLCTYLLMPNLDPYSFVSNMNNIKTSVNVLWNRLMSVKHSSLQSMLYLYSTEGGVGKSVFQNIITEWCNRRGVKIKTVQAPHNQFVSDEFNKNAICMFNDMTREECNNWCKMNNMIDASTYIVEKKGVDAYELKAQAFLIGSSNFYPKDDNNRRVVNSIVRYGETKLEPISKYNCFKLIDKQVDIDFYIRVVDFWLCSCPENDFDYSLYATSLKSSASLWSDCVDSDHLYVLQALANAISIDSSLELSIDTATKAIFRDIANSPDADFYKNRKREEFTYRKVHNVFKSLERNKLIKKVKVSKSTYLTKYDVSNVVRDKDAIIKDFLPADLDIFKNCEYDYEKEKKLVLDSIQKMLNANICKLTDEAKVLMNNLPQDVNHTENEVHTYSEENSERDTAITLSTLYCELSKLTDDLLKKRKVTNVLTSYIKDRNSITITIHEALTSEKNLSEAEKSENMFSFIDVEHIISGKDMNQHEADIRARITEQIKKEIKKEERTHTRIEI